MSSRRTTFEKTQRARKKKAKADLKRAKRQGKLDEIEIPEGPGLAGIAREDDTPAEEAPSNADWLPKGELTPAALMDLVQRCHDDYEAGRIDFDEFETRKIELMDRLSVD